jgi:hypothetical protein
MLEKGIVVPQRTNNLQAYDCYLRAVEAGQSATPEGFAQSAKDVREVG